MRKTWLAAATIAACGLAVAGCSSSNDNATPTTTAAQTTTTAPATTTAPTTAASTSASGDGVDATTFGAKFMTGTGIQSTEAINTCVGNTIVGDPDLLAVFKASGSVSNVQAAKLYGVMFDCGVTPASVAPLFTKGVSSTLTLTDTQTSCVNDQFASLSRADVIILIAKTDPTAANELGAKIATACNLTAANTSASTPA